MKKVFLLLLTFMSLNVIGQIRVKEGSFKKIDGYVMLDKYEHTDMNNAPMALIKISTENITAEQRRKFTFKGNLATYFDAHFEPGEIYLYLSAAAATFIEIIHDDFGKVEYEFPYDLCDYCAYEMVVVSDFYSADDVAPKVNYLTINVDQPNAMIFIDDEFVGIQKVSELLSVGDKHTWKIECDRYQTEMGELEVLQGDPIVINKELKPNFGDISVYSVPEDSANVYLDGKYIGLTPCIIDDVQLGQHKLVVFKDDYRSHTKEFELIETDTTYMTVGLFPDAEEIVIFADSLSEIYVDNKMKSVGKWSGKLSLGTHLIEARRQSYKSTYNVANVEEGRHDTIYLATPEPLFGHLNVSTNPPGALIYIDGVLSGVTPRVVNDLLVGQHELRLTKDGCAVLIRNINITQDLTLDLNEILHEGKNITIESDKVGDNLYVDKQYIGKSPQTISMTYGVHTISVERDGYSADQNFNVSKNGDSNVKVVFGKYLKIETDRPGDFIFVDNVEVGNSPCMTNLSFGKHTLTFRRGSKTYTKVIVVEKDDNVDVINVSLGREVTINTTKVGDFIYIDGKYMGKSPLKTYLYYGDYEVKALQKGEKETSKLITVEENSQDEYTLYYGQLVKFDSNEPGDKVILDGKKIGVTPMELDLTYGNHEVKVKRHRKLDKRNLYITKDSDVEYLFNPVKETIKEFNNNGIGYFMVNASTTMDGNSLYGLSFGGYKKVGWYISFMSNFDAIDGVNYHGLSQFKQESESIETDFEYADGRLINSRLSATAGLMFDILGPIYLKMGCGYGSYTTYRRMQEDEWYRISDSSYEGLMISAGLQFNLKHFIMSIDYMTDPGFKIMELKLGIGLGWKK